METLTLKPSLPQIRRASSHSRPASLPLRGRPPPPAAPPSTAPRVPASYPGTTHPQLLPQLAHGEGAHDTGLAKPRARHGGGTLVPLGAARWCRSEQHRAVASCCCGRQIRGHGRWIRAATGQGLVGRAAAAHGRITTRACRFSFSNPAAGMDPGAPGLLLAATGGQRRAPSGLEVGGRGREITAALGLVR